MSDARPSNHSSIAAMREAIVKLTRILSDADVKVTMQGTQAVVYHDANNRPIRVNLPYLPDNCSQELIVSTHGFLDHEVAHCLFTDFAVRTAAIKMGGMIESLDNIIEDTFIERMMSKRFRGSRSNFSTMRKWFFEEHAGKKYREAQLDPTTTELEYVGFLVVPAARAWSGQVEAQNFMDDGNKWKAIEGFVSVLEKNNLIAPLATLRNSQECLELAIEWDKVFEKPPKEESKSCSDSGDEEGDEDGDSEPSEGSGESDSKPSDGKEDKGEGEKSESKSDSEDESDEGSESKSKSEDKESDEKDADEDEDEDSSGSGSDEDEDEGGEDEDKEDSSGSGADEGEDEKDDSEDGGSDDGDSDDAEDEDEEDSDSKSESGGASSDDSETDGDEDEREDDSSEGDKKDGSDKKDSAEGDDDHDDEMENSADERDVSEVEADATEDSDPIADKKDQDYSVGEDKKEVSEISYEDLKDVIDGLKDFDEKIAEMLSDATVDATHGSRYNVFTTDYDVIENAPHSPTTNINPMIEQTAAMVGPLQKELERLIKAQDQKRYVPGQRSGKVNPSSLYRLKSKDMRVFRRREQVGDTRDVAVSLVVDCSGSMQSSGKIQLAMICAFAMSNVLDRLNISHEVIGFTTGLEMPRDVLVQWEAEKRTMREKGTPIAYGRYDPLYLPIFKGFNERLGIEQKQRMAACMKRGTQGFGLYQNVDGESIQAALRRLMAQPKAGHAMFVLSDGQPACTTDGYVDGRSILDDHLAWVVQEASKECQMYGIGIRSQAVRHYYPNYAVIQKVEELPKLVLGKLKNLILG